MKKLAFYISILLVLIACEGETPQGPNFVDPNPNDVEIRIDNQSSYTLDSIYLNTSGGEHNYNALISNRKSNYKSFEFSYSIFHLRYKVNEKTFELQPIDYVGETKVDNGKYSLKISAIDTSTNAFTYRLSKD